MKLLLVASIIVSFIFFPLHPNAQIGNKIPFERLPDGSTEAWQQAGCPFLDEPVEVAAVLNVKDLGAAGNGLADDTEAILQALEQAEAQSLLGNFSMVFFPEGTYIIKEVLQVPPKTVLKGEGAALSTLNFLHDEHAILFNGIAESGLEDLGLIRQTTQTLNKYFLRMDGAYDCWVRGVESHLANSNHFSLVESEKILIRGCYIHECTDHGGGGNGYGIVLGNETSACLIEDNIFRETRHAIVTGGLCHRNVVGYNASFEPHTSTSGGLGEWVTGDIELHGNSSNPGPQMGAYENLFEGNYFNWIWIDAYWGDNGDYNTFFRNMARKGGLVLEDHYESTNGGNHYDCNDNQTFVNNYLENLDIVTKLRYGAPWGDGYLKSTNIGGSGHFARNNKVYEVLWPSMTNLTSWKAYGEEPEYLEDTSYYHAERPDFMPEGSWPFYTFDMGTRNPAAQRFESGGPMTVTVGFSPYLITSIDDPVPLQEIIIYPNPTTQYLYFRYQISDFRYLISDLYSVSGFKIERLVDQWQGPGMHEIKVDMGRFPAGIYLLKMHIGDQKISQKVVIKNSY